MRLAVELYGTFLGTLAGDLRTFDFQVSDEGLDTFGFNSPVLSVSIPLVTQQRRDHAARRRNWFAELLPEGSQYEYMLALGALRRGDTVGFLARFGRDVAGALQIWDIDDPTEPKTPQLRALTSAQVRGLLEDPASAPLANAQDAGRSSLGGVQPKVVLVRQDSGWFQALGGYPTTHILKPQLQGSLSSVIFDEEYGSRIARRLGLASFSVRVVDFDGLNALVIERFDRDGTRRVHQEDFSQVLGAHGNEKYQELGGVVSLTRVAQVLKRSAPAEDLQKFAQMVILSVAIGNLDMHTKNLGLMHPEQQEVRLAPAYDIVPQAHLGTDGKLALAVNKKYSHAALEVTDIEAELTGWGLRRTSQLIELALEHISEAVAEETPLPGAHQRLQDDITQFVSNLQNRKPVGKPM